MPLRSGNRTKVRTAGPLSVVRSRGLTLRMCAARGQTAPSKSSGCAIGPLGKSIVLAWAKPKSLVTNASPPSWPGLTMIGAPDRQRPTNIAPTFSAVRGGFHPCSLRDCAVLSKKPLNASTFCRKRRKTRNEPFFAQLGPV